MTLLTPKISLIVPVYNAEKYIKKALESVVNQTFKDYEVIIINDGSTDSSPEIIKEFIKDRDNFHLFNQENKGLGMARNAGIKEAKGEYVSFLDSDDYLEQNFFEVLYNLIVDNDADIACCNHKLCFLDGKVKIYMPFFAKSGVYTRKKAFARLISDVTFHHYLWNKLYKRTLFTENNIEFYNMYFEDVAISPRLFYCAKKVAVTSKSLYNYLRRSDSIVAVMDSKKINDFIKSLGIMRNFLEEKNIYSKYKVRFLLYGGRVKFQVYYCIFKDHVIHCDFSNFCKNLKKARISTSLFLNKRYRPLNDPPILPFYVQTPKERREREKSQA